MDLRLLSKRENYRECKSNRVPRSTSGGSHKVKFSSENIVKTDRISNGVAAVRRRRTNRSGS